MTSGDVIALLKARIAGRDYPADDVPDTPRNRELWEKIGQDIAGMPPGVTPEVPAEWTELPDG